MEKELNFKLPEKWCIFADIEEAKNYFVSQSSQRCYNDFSKGYLHSINLSSQPIMTKGRLGASFHEHKIREDYTEITVEQFQRYVLKQNTNKPIQIW